MLVGRSRTYYFPTSGSCSSGATLVNTVAVTNGVALPSNSETPTSSGAYSWDAVYSGDTNGNAGTTSACEPLLVQVPSAPSSSGLGFLAFDFTSFTVYPVNPATGCSGPDYPGGADDYAIMGGVYPTSCTLGTGCQATQLTIRRVGGQHSLLRIQH